MTEPVPISDADRSAVAAQLGRPPRGLRAVAHRCPCGLPDVVETAPRLPDGTPFPTLYYLTCPRAASAIGGLEAGGMMRELTARLAGDLQARAAYENAHRDYLARRDEAAAGEGVEPLPPGTQSAGGMPERVKCLHALAAHELAAPGVNPFGRAALDAVGPWWDRGPCVSDILAVHRTRGRGDTGSGVSPGKHCGSGPEGVVPPGDNCLPLSGEHP
ncbi:MAG: DUF501 domain-containing protein [Nocardiopsaceae bacterium]|nr:DUF501 domain-containing protein [Nocardiopsaceae bacterium]